VTALKGTQEARLRSVVDPTRFQIRTGDGATYLVGLAGIRLPAGELAWDQETLQDFRVIMDDELLYQVPT
jgi:hypothetical protein